MDFIMIPTIFGIVTFGIYKLFELFVRRRERLLLVEKLDPSQLPAWDPGKLTLTSSSPNITSANVVSIGCLLLGMGIGILAGVLVAMSTGYQWDQLAYGGSILFFGGVGLVASVFLNRELARKD